MTPPSSAEPSLSGPLDLNQRTWVVQPKKWRAG